MHDLVAFLAVPLLLSACAGFEDPAPTNVEHDELASTAASHSRVCRRPRHHCVTEWGVDLNESLHICQPISCADDEPLPFHEAFIVLGVWITNQAGGSEEDPLVYPSDYTPSTPAPMDDFLSKLRATRYVVTPVGGGRAHTVVYRGQRDLLFTTVETVYAGSGFFPEEWMGWPLTAFAQKLPPLPPGDYRVEVFLDLRAEHCDGVGADRRSDCLPAGENRWFSTQVTIAPREPR